MKWLRLVLAGYAALLLLGLATLSALGLLEPLAIQWMLLQVAIGLGLGLLIAIVGDDGKRTGRLHRPR
jgi:hypothetical protein